MPDLPHVTRVLAEAGLGPDLTGIAPDVLEAARRRGSAVHALVDAHGYGALEPGDVEPEFKGYLDAYEAFCRDLKHEPIVSEYEVIHPAWHYVGHLDRVGWVHKSRVLIDWKVVATVDVDAVAAQLAAYEMAWEAMRPTEPIAETLAVQLKADGTYRVHVVDSEGARQVFLAALVIYTERRRRGR